MLEFAKVIQFDDMGTRMRAEQLAKNIEHSGRSGPSGGHLVGHLPQALSGCAPHSVKALLVVYRVCQCVSRRRSVELIDVVKDIHLRHDVPLVAQLVLPLIVWLFEHYLTK